MGCLSKDIEAAKRLHKLILLLNPSIHTQSNAYAATAAWCVYRVVRYVLQGT